MYRLILILLCLSSCAAQKHCKTRDKDFVDAFNRRLLLVQQLEKRSAVVGVDDYMEAIWYLSKLTGIVSRADNSSTLGYKDRTAYVTDMAAWRRWLRLNRCGFTMAKPIASRTHYRWIIALRSFWIPTIPLPFGHFFSIARYVAFLILLLTIVLYFLKERAIRHLFHHLRLPCFPCHSGDGRCGCALLLTLMWRGWGKVEIIQDSPVSLPDHVYIYFLKPKSKYRLLLP